ncbi:hypothetical protein HGH93_12915 [Chitinophaga polysaccharea]|uniref:hypothetical protein n=1 Tax=Chitinophaga polysaccharea TaxID=1293035 RepID=UPI001454F929|nr:hypothetical protein [Chitinophaga polysaccharea]NLR59009.1 hypothetical protein [Chitinophaga polysaccharea]
MKIFLLGGIITVLACLMMTLGNYRQYLVERDGTKVRMQILKMPGSCIGTKVKHHAKFIYEKKVYVKQVGGSFCDKHWEGEYVEMKYIDGVSFIMFPSETVVPAFYILFASLIFGMGCIVYSRLRRRGQPLDVKL